MRASANFKFLFDIIAFVTNSKSLCSLFALWIWASSTQAQGSNVTPCIVGTPIAAPPTALDLLGPPTVPQPQQGGDLVGVVLQNNSASPIVSNYATFGQVFIKGQVAPSDTLALKISGASSPVQMDPLAFWPDGSVRLAALTISSANLCAEQQVSALVSKSPNVGQSSVDLAAALTKLTVSLAFTSGGTSQTIDLAAALKAALLSAPDYWLKGPLATQARVDVPISGTSTLHVTADVTAYADGSVVADIQFNNDIATDNPVSSTLSLALPPLAPLSYATTITLAGQTLSQVISQSQYTDWHTTIASNGQVPTAISVSGAEPALNIQHDPKYLEYTGAISSYDLTTGISNGYGMMSSLVTVLNSTGFGLPLSGNGVDAYMPTTGGRQDIGITTGYNTIWIITQDVRAAAVALAEGDTGGAVPWNFKLRNGHWLTPADYPLIWTSPSGGPANYTDSLLNAPDTTVWAPDRDHAPNLAYIPYIMTANRWYLDRLNAEAAFFLSYDWPVARCSNPPSCSGSSNSSDIVLNGADDVRAQAWSFREIMEASFVGKPNTFEASYFTKVVLDNWTFEQKLIQSLSSSEGEATGWQPPTLVGQIRPWQQDYLTLAVALDASMGDANAVRFLNWQVPWLSGRFTAADFNPYDGCAYILVGADQVTLIPYTTWSTIEAITVAAGQSNGKNGTLLAADPFADADYCPLARGAVGSTLNIFPNNAKLKQAYSWIENKFFNLNSIWYIPDVVSFQLDPTWNIVPLK